MSWYVRFQFRSTTFAELVRDQLARSDVGCIPSTGSGWVVEHIGFPQAGPTPMDVAQGLVLSEEVMRADVMFIKRPPIVDDTVFGDWPYDDLVIPVAGGAPITVRRRRLLLTLPIELRVRQLSDLIKGTGTPIEFTLDVRLKVDLVHRDGKDFISVGYDSLGHHEGTNPGIESVVASELSNASVAPREVPFDFGARVLEALANMGGGGEAPAVAWSGMTLSGDRQTVEFRLEVTLDDPSGTHFPDDWRIFHNRQIDSVRGDRDWATAIGSEVLRESIRRGAANEIAKQDDFSLDHGPEVEWRPDLPGFRTTFSGELVDACLCFGYPIDVNTDVAVESSLSLPVPGPTATVRVDSFTSHDETNGWETGCCAVTGALFWPIIGWVYLAEGKVGWGGMLLGLFGGPIGALITLAYLFDPRPHEQQKDDCSRDPDNDSHEICNYQVALNPTPDRCNPSGALINLDAVTGRADALVLAGSISQQVLAAPTLEATAPGPFEWVPPAPTCSGTEGYWHADTSFQVGEDGGGYPLKVCDVLSVGPIPGLYKPTIVSVRLCPTLATIDVESLPWYPGFPHPSPMLVLTNVGAMVIDVPPLPPLTAKQQSDYEHFLIRWRLQNCSGIFDGDWFVRDHPLKLQWLVDPKSEPRHRHRLWVVRAAKLAAGELIVLRSGLEGHAELATGVADERKGVRLELLNDEDMLVLERRAGSAKVEGPGEEYGISITNVVLEEVATAALGAPALGLRPIGSPHRPDLEVLFGDGGSERLGIDLTRSVLGEPPAPGNWRPPPAGTRGTRVVGAAPPPAEDPRAGLGQLALGSARRAGIAAHAGAVAGLRQSARARRWILDAGGGGYLEVDERRGEALAHYRDRPWTDGLIRIRGGFVRLDDDRLGLRLYAIRAHQTL
jgi:hypothetical protein